MLKEQRTRNAFILSNGADTGGLAHRSARAFDAYPFYPWGVRAMVTNPGNYIAYPEDVKFHPRVLAAYYDAADVVVLNSTMYGHHRYDDGQGKATILMHHGHHEGHFALSLTEAIAEAASLGAIQACSTVDLELEATEASGPITWMPTAYDLDYLARLRSTYFEPKGPEDPIIVGHFPTNREIKSTEEVIAAVNRLKMAGVPVELLLIEKVTNAEVLRIKARDIDIMVDQLNLGYGCNAIEAWAMGIPVIAGTTRPGVREHMLARYDLTASPTGLPFIEPRVGNLEWAIHDLVVDREMQVKWGQIGLTHVKRWHSQISHVALWTHLFEQAIQTRTVRGNPRRLRDGGPHRIDERRISNSNALATTP